VAFANCLAAWSPSALWPAVAIAIPLFHERNTGLLISKRNLRSAFKILRLYGSCKSSITSVTAAEGGWNGIVALQRLPEGMSVEEAE
jgi:hypothetical protein